MIRKFIPGNANNQQTFVAPLAYSYEHTLSELK